MAEIKLYVFDLDHTLIGMDSDYSWKIYAEKRGLASSDAVKEADKYLADYAAGRLEPDEFIAFQYAEFAGKTPDEVDSWTSDYFAEMIRPKIYDDAFEYISQLRRKDAPMVILSSTADVIVKVPADYFGINTLIGTHLEVVDGRYTGKVAGTYALREGKVTALAEFCRQNSIKLEKCAYYGDSINDCFVMEEVGFPFAVNPDCELAELAKRKNWTILNWK